MRTPRTRTLPTLLLALVPCVLVGCANDGGGGDGDGQPLSKAEYQKAILRALNHEVPIGNLYYDLVVPPVPRDECTRKLDALHDEGQELVDEVAALSAPDDVADIQARFVDAATRSANRVGELRDQVAAGEIDCNDLNTPLYGMPSNVEAEAAIADLEKQGYFVYGE